MKDGKKQKPHGMKHKIRKEKKKEGRIGLAVLVSILTAITIVSGFLINSRLNRPSTGQTVTSISELRATIVDHLSLTYPNQTFIQTATNILRQAGYTVDYHPGEEVTVDFYRTLPTQGHSIMILRVHSALVSAEEPPVTLFTSESYSGTKYVYEQMRDRVGWVTYRFENGTPKEPTYFGISPLFVKQSMNGMFQDTIIILMGCNGLTYADMAQAFIQKGARAYISWSDAVIASHTDQATIQLLKHLVAENQTIMQAVTETMEEVGPDQVYRSQLGYYPLEVGDQTVEEIKDKTTTNP